MNNKEFINLYNELDAYIAEKYDRFDEDSSIYFLINKFRKSNIEIEKEYSKKLDSIRKIRNIYVHESGIIEDLFDVSNDVINTLKEVIDYIKHPLLAKDVMTPFKEVKVASLNSKVQNLIEIIYKEGFSNIPIVNDFNIVIGIFNSDVLVNLSFHKIEVDKNTIIQDIEKYITFDAHFNNRFIFVNERSEIDSLNEYFSKSKEQYKKRLPLIFVTQNGKSNGVLKGIIAPIDLLKLPNLNDEKPTN